MPSAGESAAAAERAACALAELQVRAAEDARIAAEDEAIRTAGIHAQHQQTDTAAAEAADTDADVLAR